MRQSSTRPRDARRRLRTHGHAVWVSLAVAVALSACQASPSTPGAATLPSDPRLVLAPPELPHVQSLPLAPVSAGLSQDGVATRTDRHVLADTSSYQSARILVVSADGNEAALPAITGLLARLGEPYTLWVASQHPGGLTSDKLTDGYYAYYQAVILATNELGVNDNGTWKSALGDAEWQTLRSFEATFGVRQVNWYAYPDADLGYGPAAATTATVSGTWTTAGRQVFGYLNLDMPVAIRNAYTFLARPTDPAVTPLLVDASGDALVSTHRYADGRESLAMTFDSNPYLLHTLVLGYGALKWATKGVLLGRQQAYVDAEVDGMFGTDAQWHADPLRLAQSDLQGVEAWQTQRQKDPNTPDFRLTLAFDGAGTSATDGLTAEARAQQAQFKWVSHTFDGTSLEAATYDQAAVELSQNNAIARSLGFATSDKRDLVTPAGSGLANPDAMRAAFDAGVRFVVTDGQTDPSPNTGIPNALQAGILEVPRRPTNLFYNVSTPDQWTAEYNAIYRSYWHRDISYQEILDKESDVMLYDLLTGSLDPFVFHQANLHQYAAGHSLLGDLLDALFKKYDRLLVQPIQSPTLDALGQCMLDRATYNATTITATLKPGVAITIGTDRAVTFPVTGLGDSTTWAPITEVHHPFAEWVTYPFVRTGN